MPALYVFHILSSGIVTVGVNSMDTIFGGIAVKATRRTDRGRKKKFWRMSRAYTSDAVIPPRSNRTDQRTYDDQLFKERHLVECCINKVKWYRRAFSRFDKIAARYFGFLCFVSSLIWLR